MRPFSTLVVASVASLTFATAVLAQPRPYEPGQPPRGAFTQGPQQGPGRYNPPPPRGPAPQQARGPGQGARSGGQYYYNGRWVDRDEWRRHEAERERWSRSYRQRRGGDGSSSLIAGIIGFALGAAIVGSTQQAERARTADETWQDSCARRYRSYDRASRTYMGYDGLRHYCQ